MKDDFDLKKIAESGQCFRWAQEGDNTFRIVSQGHLLRIAQEEENGELRTELPGEDRAFWENYFDLQTSYSQIRAMVDERDPYLSCAARYGTGLRILRQDPWEMLITFILSQRKSIPAIRSCVEKLCAAAGEEREDPGRPGEVWHDFPTPRAILSLSDEQIAATGAGYRLPYLRDAAAMVESGELDLSQLQRLGDEELCSRLECVCGVGEKVAKCVMLFGFHRMDAFPQDVWMHRALTHYPQGFPFERYRPWNGLMQQYLFCYARDHEEKKPVPHRRHRKVVVG